MISESFEGLSDNSHDVCIVGAGTVGIALASEMARLGHSVLLLESGMQAANAGIQELSAADIVTPDNHDDMSIAVSRQLGGTSNLWGARCVQLDPVDFIARPGLMDARWPITFEDLLPYYERACWHTQSGAPVFNLPIPGLNPSDNAFSVDRLERSANEPKAQIVHRKELAESPKIDVRLGTVVKRLHFEPGGLISGLDIVRPDGSQPRRLGVRNVVIAAGGLESTRLLLAAQRETPGRFGDSEGPLGRYYMGHMIGDIADIVLANATLDKAMDYFIDANGSYVRRRFMPSQETQLRENILNIAMFPVVPPVADARHGSAILSMVYLALSIGPLGRLIVAEAIRRRHMPSHPVSTISHLLNVAKGILSAIAFGADFLYRRYLANLRLPGFFVRNKNFRYGLHYHSEQIPIADSRVTLNGEFDRTGLPKIRIDLRFHEAEARSVVRAHELFSDWLIKTGLGRLEWRWPQAERVEAVLRQARHGTHQIGTIRMGENRTEGVVDRNLRTFDCANLFVASTAVFPTSGQANPTLSAVALAVRLAHAWSTLRPAGS